MPKIFEVLTGDGGGVVLVVLFVLAAIIVGMYKFVKAILPGIQKLLTLANDLNGTPARGLNPARPSMMDSIALLHDANVEQSKAIEHIRSEQEDQGRKIEIIRHEVEFNNGTSVKDAAIRTENDVKAVRGEIEAVKESVEAVRILLDPTEPNEYSISSAE
jgi:hypothetical protein